MLCCLINLLLLGLPSLAYGAEEMKPSLHFAVNNNPEQSVLLIRINTAHSSNKLKGLDHLTEHMLFKGTEQHPRFTEFMDYLADNGVRSNARASENSLIFYYVIKNKQLEKNIKRVFAQFKAPLFHPEQIQKELTAFKEEVEKNKNSTYQTLIGCEYEQLNSIVYEDSVINIPVQEISERMHQFYKEIWQPNRVSLFLWTAKKAEDIEVNIDDLFPNQGISEPISNDKGKKANPNDFVAFCNSATPNSGYEFTLSLSLENRFVQPQIENFFIASFDKDSSFIEQLQKNTGFKKVTFLQSSERLRVIFVADKAYSVTDAVKAKKIFFKYLNHIIDGGVPNYIRKAALFSELIPSLPETSFLSISNKFNEITKQKFAGKVHGEQLKAFSTFLLNTEKSWVFTSTSNKDVLAEMARLDEKLEGELEVVFQDTKLNKYFPIATSEVLTSLQSNRYETQKLAMLDSNIGVHPVYQNNDSNLVALLFEVKTSSKSNLPPSFYGKVKKEFQHDNQVFLTALKDAYVDVKLEGKDSLKVFILSHHFNLPKVVKALIPKIKATFNQQSKGEPSAFRYLLIGYLHKELVGKIKHSVLEHFALQAEFSPNKINENKNEGDVKQCRFNCLRYSLDFLSYNKAKAFGSILERLNSNDFFREVRFNQGLSYDAKIVSMNHNGKPEVRIYMSNSSINHQDIIKQYFEKTIKDKLSKSKTDFNKAKQNVIKRLNNKTEYLQIVKSYWQGLLERNTLFQDPTLAKKYVKQLTHEEFMQIYNTLIENVDKNQG